MLFNSLEFLIFFLIIYGLYLILSHRWQNRMLLLASYIFYGFWDYRFLSLIFISTLVDYFCGLGIESSQNITRCRRLLIISIVVNLSLLGVFKYFNFFASGLSLLLSNIGIGADLRSLNIILPVGISFYTFQTMSYTIDIYRGKLKPTRKFLDFALFVAFFPQLVAGPIERARRLLPQILQPRKLSLNSFYEGCFLIFWGLFEKIFISGNLALIVDPVFAEQYQGDGGRVLIALYAFAFQIFCDFDGYSNIARGLGKCMGFELMNNFNIPYIAADPKEFWQRWHISLSSWLRDYLYIPLGGNRGSRGRTNCNLMLTMLLGGLWHGAAWTFVAWGAYHGILLIIYRRLNIVTKKFLAIRIFLFFHIITLSWLLFRAESFAQVNEMFAAMLFNLRFAPDTILIFLRMLIIILPLLCVQVGQYVTKDRLFLFRRHWLIKTFIYAVFVYLMAVWGIFSAEEFIYFQF